MTAIDDILSTKISVKKFNKVNGRKYKDLLSIIYFFSNCRVSCISPSKVFPMGLLILSYYIFGVQNTNEGSKLLPVLLWVQASYMFTVRLLFFTKNLFEG